MAARSPDSLMLQLVLMAAMGGNQPFTVDNSCSEQLDDQCKVMHLGQTVDNSEPLASYMTDSN
jgi:hypothetical protein